ncbi:hypothetical protein IT570_11585 [Candidatus Sumerlaeota bacterium]|nr:hypothetical protein [Candidatus Sumerlaeota bacterium]
MELNLAPIKFSRTRALLWVAAVVWFSGLCWWHRNVAIDDAWITFRYARNLALGEGFVFNAGEALEGYSNFLWVLVSSAAISANVEPLGAVRAVGWLGVVLGFALLIYGVPGARALANSAPRVTLETATGPVGAGVPESPPFSSATAALIMAAAYPLAVWTMMGLETAFYAMLLLALVMMLNELWRDPLLWKSIATGLLLVALALTRPEGAMWASLLFSVFMSRDRARLGTKLALPLAVFASVFVVYTAWRFETFGTIIPNTVTAKVGGGAESSLGHGAIYFLRALGGGFLALFICAVAVVWRHVRRNRDAEPPQGNLVVICGFALALQTAFAIGVGGDWMPSARFLVPALPPLVILAALVIRPWPLFVRLVVLAYFFFSGFFHARDEQMLRWCRWAGRELGNQLITAPSRDVGIYLRENARPSDVLAATEAGVTPYYSRLAFIDMLGLVDAHIASLQGGLHEKFDAAYVLSREPDLILLAFEESKSGPIAKWQPDQEMLAYTEFQKNYAEVRRWPRPMNGPNGGMLKGWMVLFKRKDS